MLLSQNAFKRKKKTEKRKKEHLVMCSKPRTFGATQKKFIQSTAQKKKYFYVFCRTLLTFTLPQNGNQKKKTCQITKACGSI